MGKDMCVPCGGGIVNIRVGAIILKNGKVLMTGNERSDYLYSVGGRIQFGETAEEAVIREVWEETGRKLEIDRLGFVHENYFYGDSPGKLGKLVYEISLFFYMKVPEDFDPVSESFTEDGSREFLQWVAPGENVRLFPEFFHRELVHPTDSVRYYVNDNRVQE